MTGRTGRPRAGSPPPAADTAAPARPDDAAPARAAGRLPRLGAVPGQAPPASPPRRRGSSPRRPEGAALAAPALVRRLPAETGLPDTRGAPHFEALAQRLEALPFADTAVVDLFEQQALEREYIEWASEQLAVRQAAFGEHAYSLDMTAPPTLLREAAPGIVFDALSAGLKSAMRSPIRSAVAARFDQELTYRYDVSVTSGVASALPAMLAAQVVVPALKTRARVSNLQALEPVDPKVLFPDPGPVVLRITYEEGVRKKSYVRPIETRDLPAQIASQGGTDRPSRQDLQAEVDRQRERLTRWQAMLSGTRGGTLTKPSMTGALSALRRHLSSDSMLTTASGVLAGSAVSSFGASALTEALQGIAKSVPRISAVTIADLAGGSQRVNVFKLVRPDATQPPAGWSDLRDAPAFVADSLREMAALASHALLPDWRAATPAHSRPEWNIVATAQQWVGIVTANTFATVCGDACGPYFAQIIRGAGAAQAAGESPRSAANIAQQFASSGMNELLWGSMSGENAFGALSIPHARALENFRERILVTRKRKMADNDRQIDDLRERLRQASADQAMPYDEMESLRKSVRDLEIENARLLQRIRSVHAWTRKTSRQRAAGT